MKVLQLCKKSPTPQKDGESIAIHQITKALLLNNAEIDVLAMLTPKHPEFDVQSEAEKVNYQYNPINTNLSLSRKIKSILNFGDLPYILERFKDEFFEESLISKLKSNSYDFIILEGIFLGIYLKTIKKHSNAKIVLRAHNVESQIWKRIALESNNSFKKSYLKGLMNPKFETFENEVVKNVDAVISISPIDNQHFINHQAKKTLCFPVCVEDIHITKVPQIFQVGFLGGLDWEPNKKGVEWFLKKVWSKFIENHPNAQFNLAGRNFPNDILNWKFKGVNFLGEIDNAQEFIQNQSLMIAPIFSGSGMRVKIIEAMSNGKCVLSTKVGAEGINYKHQENIFIAENKKEWVGALEYFCQQKAELKRIGENANVLMEKEYTLKVHAQKLNNFLKNL